MGIFSGKGEGPAETDVRDEPAQQPQQDAAPGAGRTRLRRVVLGAAVLLTAVVVAAPFFVSDRALEAENVAKTSIPPVPAAPVQASVPSTVASAVAQAASPAASVVPAAPGGSPPMPAADPELQKAPPAPAAASRSGLPQPADLTAEEAARIRAKEDAAAKARAKEIAARNAKAKAEIDKKAKAQKKAADDELAAAIQARNAKEPAKKEAAPEAKKPAAGRWTLPVGSFSSAEAARKVVANARANGVALSVSTVKTDKGTLSRVSAGPFSSRAEAEQAEARLAMAGIRTGAIRQLK